MGGPKRLGRRSAAPERRVDRDATPAPARGCRHPRSPDHSRYLHTFLSGLGRQVELEILEGVASPFIAARRRTGFSTGSIASRSLARTTV